MATTALAVGCKRDADEIEHDVDQNGGTVTSVDRQLTLDFPPGAVSEPVSIQIDRKRDVPEGVIGRAFEVSPAELELELDVTVIFSYAGKAVDDPSSLDVAILSDDAWSPLPSLGLDEDAMTVAGSTDALGVFALVDVGGESSPDTATGASGTDTAP